MGLKDINGIMVDINLAKSCTTRRLKSTSRNSKNNDPKEVSL